MHGNKSEGELILKKQYTLEDIANLVGVNKSTVSRALSNHPGISEERKKEIKKIAQQLNYKPNQLARGLRAKKTGVIGLIIPDIENPFYPEVTRKIEDLLHANGYNLMLCNSDYDSVKEKQYLNLLLSKQVDGIIIFPTMIKREKFDVLYQYKTPFVFMDANPEKEVEGNYVYVDHIQGAYQSIKYLIKQGHDSIALYTGENNSVSSVEQIYRGYRKALREAEIEFNKNLIFNVSLLDKKDHQEITLDILKQKKYVQYSAIFCISDVFARFIYKMSPELNLKIPDDLSIIGYDNTYICSFLNPPLTSVNQPVLKLAHKAAGLILKQIDNYSVKKNCVKFNPELIVRDSVQLFKD